MAKLLLIEDDAEMALQLRKWLEADLHVVEHAETGKEALFRLSTYEYDLAIVDWNLPDMQGIDICKQVRCEKLHMPLLMLTSRGDVEDKIVGLDGGATDYLVKPPDLLELSARIRSLLRRQDSTIAEVFNVGNLQIDESARTVFIDKKSIKIPPIEFDLLLLFAKNIGKPLSRASLVAAIWPQPEVEDNNNLKVRLMNLRKKLADGGSDQTVDYDAAAGYSLRVTRASSDA